MKRHARLVLVLAIAALFLTAALAVAQGTPQPKPKRINLNTATQAELETLKGIGPALAQKIIAARPFKTVSDLKNVPGLSQATYDEIKSLVTVRAATTSAKPQAAEPAPAETKPTPKPKTKTTTAPVEKPAGGLVNLNTADKAALEALPGVGAATADAIIAARPFKTIDDLKNVKGISDAKFAKLGGLVTVGRPRTTTPKVETPSTPAPKTKTSAGAAAPSAAGPVDLNTADKAALESLPGVGPALADRIIAARPFNSVDDLKNVTGIGDVKFAALKDLVVVGHEEEAVQPKLRPGETININTASQADLEKLLGIGPVRAQAIIAGRPYAKIEDIMKVKGIKEKTFAKIKDYIVVR